MDVHGFTVGPVAENCFFAARDGASEAIVVDPGDEADRLIAALEELRPGRRGDPPHPHALRPRRRRRAARAPHRRAGLLPRAREARARRHHELRPVARVRAVRVLRRRRARLGRRAARARGPRDRRALHAGPLARPRHLLDPRPSRRCSPATCCSRARSAAPTSRAATRDADAHARRPRRARCPTRPTVYPGHMGVTTIGSERATNPFLRELAVPRSLAAPPGPRQTVDAYWTDGQYPGDLGNRQTAVTRGRTDEAPTGLRSSQRTLAGPAGASSVRPAVRPSSGSTVVFAAGLEPRLDPLSITDCSAACGFAPARAGHQPCAHVGEKPRVAA